MAEKGAASAASSEGSPWRRWRVEAWWWLVEPFAQACLEPLELKPPPQTSLPGRLAL